MTPDCDEIDRLIDWAEASHIAGDGEWDQSWYATTTECGTAYCIAGKWAVDHGWRYTGGAWLNPAGNCAGPSGAAMSGLGLSDFQAFGESGTPGLFSASNTIDDLRRIAKDLRTEAGL